MVVIPLYKQPKRLFDRKAVRLQAKISPPLRIIIHLNTSFFLWMNALCNMIKKEPLPSTCVWSFELFAYFIWNNLFCKYLGARTWKRRYVNAGSTLQWMLPVLCQMKLFENNSLLFIYWNVYITWKNSLISILHTY